MDLFDARAGMSFSRSLYGWEQLPPASLAPITDDFVRQEFIAFVRGEFGTGSRRGACPPQRVCRLAGSIPFKALETSRDESETLVYGGYLDDLIRRTGGSNGDKVLAVLSDDRLGNPANRRNIDKAAFLGLFDTLARTDSRVRFVFLGFPFKDQNIFRTSGSASAPDLAEVLLLIRLHALTLALFQLVPHGVDWIVLSDGVPYHEIFRVDLSDVLTYRNRLQSLRTRLNLTGSVHVLDLQHLVDCYVDEQGQPYVEAYAKDAATKLYAMTTENDEDVWRAMAVLKRGIKWNMRLRDILLPFEWERSWEILNTDQPADLYGAELETWQRLDELATSAAVRYAAINIGLRTSKLLSTMLPLHVRATAHAKLGQVAIPQLGDVFPWNGIGVADRANFETRLATAEAVPLFELYRQSESPEYFRLDDQLDPFVYVR